MSLYSDAHVQLFDDADKGECYAVIAYHNVFGCTVIVAEFLWDENDNEAKTEAKKLADSLVILMKG